tara:strand:+ start:1852 stop:2331 length:480 start_codon:yes stop_codon:yes gene_type:complete
MLGASLTEVWGSDFNTKPKKEKKKKYKQVPLSPEEMDSGLLIQNNERPSLMEEKERLQLLSDNRQENRYQRINPNVVTQRDPYGTVENKRPSKIEEDPDYQEFLEFKKNKHRFVELEKNKNIVSLDNNEQFNELLLYVFTGFFLLILYDSIYRLGKNSY